MSYKWPSEAARPVLGAGPLSAAKWPFEGPSPACLLSLTARRRSLKSKVALRGAIARRRLMAVLAVLVQSPLKLFQAQLLHLDPFLQLSARRLDQRHYGFIAGVEGLSDFFTGRRHCAILCINSQIWLSSNRAATLRC